MKIPPDAFDFYIGLGIQRTYAAVGKHYGVSSRAVTKRAAKEHWQERLATIEQQARERSDAKATDTLEAINLRHLQTFRVIQSKALQALQAMPLSSGDAAVRALDIAVRGERLILGEPSDRSAVSFEEVARREFERWMPPVEEADEVQGNGGDDEAPSTNIA